MAELQTPAGEPVDTDRAEVERQFAQAMADTPAADAPPRRTPPPPGDAAAAAPKRRGRPPKAEQPRVEAGAAAAPLTDEQRAAGVAGLVQLGAGFCLIANRATGSQALKADAITLASSADDFAAAAVEVARADAKFARLVDKIASAGPYGALIQVTMATGLQLARNHKPDAQLPGTRPPAELIAEAEAPAAA